MATTETVEPSPKIDGMDKWEVEDGARTLRRAFEIRDKPKLFKAALKIVRKEQEAGKKMLGWAGKL